MTRRSGAPTRRRHARLVTSRGCAFCRTPNDASTIFVAHDGDEAWKELGPFLMHDVRSYAEWNEGDEGTASLSFVDSAEALRAENRSHRILSVEEAVESVRAGLPLALHPFIGGLPPEMAWKYLRTVVDDVMPGARV